MYYIVQENTFREENYDNLIFSLDRLGLKYEIVKVLPFVDNIVTLDNFNGTLDENYTNHLKDIYNVFIFGSTKLARIGKTYNWNPGSMLNDNHNFEVYKNYYKDNLLNYDSKIINFSDNFDCEDNFFARPVLDNKTFTGKVFNKNEWNNFVNYSLTSGHHTSLNETSKIQISSVKEIEKEFRFWIVKGEIVTYSQYRCGNWINYSEFVDDGAIDFCKEMIKLFQLADAFVMDICLTNNEYKIIECGCINAAGFYRANLQKLLISLDDAFTIK